MNTLKAQLKKMMAKTQNKTNSSQTHNPDNQIKIDRNLPTF